ncbi:MAG: hypothetical protein ACRD2A_02280 [Vicinamibacterales bacterium]
MLRTASLVIGSVLGAGAILGAVDELTPQLSAAFQEKVLVIVQNGADDKPAPRTTPFVENELNSYLRFGVTELLPVGLTEPSAKLMGQGRATLRAIVNLDMVRKAQGKKSWYDPTAYLTGRIPIMTTGVLQAAEGKGRFAVERIEVKGVPMPKRLLQEILSYYTKSAEYPNGVNLDDPFTLPAQIRRVDVEVGRAIITQ